MAVAPHFLSNFALLFNNKVRTHSDSMGSEKEVVGVDNPAIGTRASKGPPHLCFRGLGRAGKIHLGGPLI